MKYIARVHSQFPAKFGIPRQSGLIAQLKSTVVFEPEYRNPDALRGLDGFSHIWLIWEFSEAKRDTWSATVRPPRLGGNARMGVFATRSPFRPNPIGLSCVKLDSVELQTSRGPVLHISGADIMDGTPVYDIKPYLPYADCIPSAVGGFAASAADETLTVEFSQPVPPELKDDEKQALISVLAHDPRPAYSDDPKKIYGMEFAGFNIHFSVCSGRLTVLNITKR